MSSTKKLSYFDANGLGEMSRLILHYGGHKFEDIRHVYAEWPVKEVKDSLPFGKLPVYEENGRHLNQSMAIARYAGTISGLVPSDPFEAALLDATVLTLIEFSLECWYSYNDADETKKPEVKRKLIEETVPYYLSRFEKGLEANNGHFSQKLSWADFVLATTIENINFLGEVDKGYPNIVALVEEIRALPGVKEYLTNKPKCLF